jgi:pimeloyl-ACP methyl ester carboxylesterase
VLSYDRPGYGGSDFDPARTLLSDASDVEALLDHFKIATVRVLAFSGGAPSAYAVGARLQERVEHIGIVSGAVWPTAAAPSSEAVSAAAESLRADPEAAVARLGDNAPMRDAEVLADPSSATTAST